MDNQERPTRGRPRDPDLARRRRETILRQAVLHFANLGFDKADVAAIAASAGCSKGTVYNYFSSKRELFREAVDHVMDGLLEATRNPEAEESIKAFKFAVESFLSYFTEHPEYIELLIQERAYFKDRKDPSYLEYRKEHCLRRKERLQSLIERGVFRDIPLDRTLDLISNLLYGTIFNNYFSGNVTDLSQQAADITDLLLYGLVQREGKQE